jgi:hypothetical protein
VITLLSAALAGLVVPAQADADADADARDVVLTEDISPRYNRTDYESACGSAVFRVRFRNGPDGHGRVDRVSIDGRPIAAAVEQMADRAARRVLTRIGIMNCGSDPKQPVFRGVMEFSAIESRRLGMRPSLFFRVSRQGHEGWRLAID